MVPVKSFMVPREKFITIERDTDAQTAARIMRDRGIGSLFVTNGKEIVGILTDTDMVRRVVAAGAGDVRHREGDRHAGRGPGGGAAGRAG